MGQYKYSVIDFIDSPDVLDTLVTNIPGSGSATLTIVASMAAQCSRIQVRDGIGTEFFNLYVGAVGSEVKKAILGCAGPSEIDVSIAPGARVSLRSASTSVISSGSLTIMFMA